MKFGMTDAEFKLFSELVITPLKDAGCEVWIFGSRATGVQQPFSDIDVLYKAPEKSTLALSSLVAHVREEVEESRLAYKVDLVRDEDLAKSYLSSVMKSRIAV